MDTYDSVRGVRTARFVFCATWDGGPGCAVRLDSGDLGDLAGRARAELDRAGLPDVRVVASGGLDEYGVDTLARSGAPIDVYAVGTRVGTSADAPYPDSAYKLVEYDGRPVMKLSSAKVTSPGRKQVFRRPGGDDVIALRDEPGPAGAEPLLRTVMRDGSRACPSGRVSGGPRRRTADLATLPADTVRVRAPRPARPMFSERLSELTAALGDRLRS